MTDIISRTQKTEESYLARGASLMDHFEDDTGKHWSDDPLESCEWLWLRATKRNWSRSSWRQNKNALIFFMTSYGPKEAVDYLKGVSVSGLPSRSYRTSGKKMKRLNDTDLNLIMTAANLSSKWDVLLQLWLRSSVLTGLRPSEWVGASLKDNIMTVINAKNTNGRAYADHRRLDISGLNSAGKKGIERTIELINNGDYDYEIIYKSVRRRLGVLTARLWPKRKLQVTLYSGRHQFRANCASAGFSKDDVAALMGHASIDSATAYYAQKSVGTGTQNVKPHPDDVAIVKSLNEHRDSVSARYKDS